MTIHKEGRKTILSMLLTVIALFVIVQVSPESVKWLSVTLCSVMAVSTLIVMFFYRFPNRQCEIDDNTLYIPADGKIVAYEKVMENDYFKEERIQVSIFMSLTNVHVNWVPTSGTIVWKEHSDGKNYPAHNPKASGLNENCKTVIKLKSGTELMVNQIAGLMARRVVNNKEIGNFVTQGDELGIIKFGSRVDIFLPLDADIKVAMGQKVKAKKTILAKIQ